MSKKNKIFVKDMGNGLSTHWNPYKTIHQMRMEDDNPHLKIIERMFDIDSYIGTSVYDEMKKRWVDSRLFIIELIEGFTYGVTYDMKLKIINNKVICKNLLKMYLNEEETKEEIEFSQTHVKYYKQTSLKEINS